MKIISHRGNINGRNEILENNPSHILQCLQKYKYLEFELDVWYIRKEWYLGHDFPKYIIDIGFLENKRFWCHCKNFDALNKFVDIDSRSIFFWHEKDYYTLTSNNYLWTYPYDDAIYSCKSILVLPDILNKKINENVYAICTDFPERYINE